MQNRKQISVLLLDDSHDLVRLYKVQLENLGPFRVTIQTDGYQARRMAEKQCFDVIVIDAKLDYRGVEFGGLRLADDLRYRYGTNSILVISRFITSELMHDYGANYEFMEKYSGVETASFCEGLSRKMQEMRKRQYLFVAMPFSTKHANAYRGVRVGVKKAGFNCVRGDEIAHNRPIQEVIFELVEKSKMVIFVADDGNPNAYYEAGFADAMRKEVIIVASSLKELRLDIQSRHTITYGTDLGILSSALCDKITSLRLSDPIVV